MTVFVAKNSGAKVTVYAPVTDNVVKWSMINLVLPPRIRHPTSLCGVLSGVWGLEKLGTNTTTCVISQKCKLFVAENMGWFFAI